MSSDTDTAPPPSSGHDTLAAVPPPARVPFEPSLRDIYDGMQAMRAEGIVQHRQQRQMYALARSNTDLLRDAVHRIDERLAEGDRRFGRIEAFLEELGAQNRAREERDRERDDRISAQLAELSLRERAPERVLAGVTVLILEDDPALRMSMSRVCVAAGAGVVTASSVTEAQVALSAIESPAAATVDLLLGNGADGMPFVRELVAHRDDVGVVIVSGRISAEQAEEADALGVRVIPKPFAPDELVAALSQAQRAAAARPA